jgi:outer membrane PBP1 activator LpoA protein
MTKGEAERVAAGYAWGQIDGARVTVAIPRGQEHAAGSQLFAEAFADAWEKTGGTITVADAFATWQRSGGSGVDPA